VAAAVDVIKWSPTEPNTLAIAGGYYPQGFTGDVVHSAVYLYSTQTGESDQIFLGGERNRIRTIVMTIEWSSDGRHLFFRDHDVNELVRYDIDTKRSMWAGPREVSTIFYQYTPSLISFSVLR